MSAKDLYHVIVKEILVAEGWTITHDPLEIEWQEQPMSIDLAAEQLIAAQRGERKIAVEVKSFLNPSTITDFYAALGQYMVYQRALRSLESDRVMYLAVPIAAYKRIFEDRPVGLSFLDDGSLFVMVYNPVDKELAQWIPNPLTEI